MATKATMATTPKYYEMDGALRAYANRTIVIAAIAVIVALISVGALVLVRMQPPTVIRVLPSGEATVVSPSGNLKDATNATMLDSVVAAQAPNDLEKEAFVRTFLDRYLNYDAFTLTQNWSAALNMMTVNLRQRALSEIQKNETVSKYQAQQVRSTFKLTNVEQSKDDNLTFRVFGVRTITHLSKQSENAEQVVEAYRVRLAASDRSAKNPTGLMIAEFAATQIHGEDKQPELAIGGAK